MLNKINLFVKPTPTSNDVYLRTTRIFQENGYEISRMYHPESTYNVVIGGDGSFLRAVHLSQFSTIPFLGINTGHLGFFQEISQENLEEYLSLLFQGSFFISHLSLIRAEIETTSWTYHLDAVNEFVLQSENSNTLRLRIDIDDVPFINTAGDGLILSTPAGSTAYNLSVGGSILHQTLNGYQISSLAPIRSKSYDSLPASIVLPADSTTCIVPEQEARDQIRIVCDGIRHRFLGVERIRFTVPSNTIRRVVFHSNWYWHNLREKLF